MKAIAAIMNSVESISAVAVVTVVGMFLAHMKASAAARDKVFATITESCHSFQSELTNRHDEMSRRVGDALDRNTEQMGQSTQALNKCTEQLAKLDSDVVGELRDIARISAQRERKERLSAES